MADPWIPSARAEREHWLSDYFYIRAYCGGVGGA
jgi:hypothetical protein